ncbi:MAG: zinc-binding dehydrogenase [Spirochaetaceae bacterium]|nr:zinc-binding dehydrogenase [Spirochaetaceae bacterium]
MKFTRAFLMEPRRFELREIEESPGDDDVLVKIASCGLCNWELNFWKGNLNYLGYPHPLGHEYAGTVVEVGAGVKTIKAGDKVSCYAKGFGGFSEYKVLSGKACIKLDDSVDAKYALGEPQKCIITVLRAAAPEAGDHGVVLGCGPMGLWCIQALAGRLLNTLVAIDVDDAKLEMAKKYGATNIINSKRENVEERLKKITKGQLADFVIEGTGVPALLNVAQRYVKPSGRGRLVLMSSHSEAAREFDFRQAVDRALAIIVAHPGYSLNQDDDFRRAVELVNNGTFKVKELVSHEFKLSEIQTAFETLEHKPAGFLKGIVVP